MTDILHATSRDPLLQDSAPDIFSPSTLVRLRRLTLAQNAKRSITPYGTFFRNRAFATLRLSRSFILPRAAVPSHKSASV